MHSDTPVQYWAVIPAAGTGQRLGAPIAKQYLRLKGKTILEHTIAKFLYHPRIEKVVVAINARDTFWPGLGLEGNPKIAVTTGGAHRSHSVYAGLSAIAPYARPGDFILVHDAVRPCIQHSDIDKLIEIVGNHPVGGILGTKVRDSLKHSNEHNDILRSVSRDYIWQALTPQMFRFNLLQQALEKAIRDGNSVTDEAGAIESLGFVPTIVEGRPDNIKITYTDDLALADNYL